MRVDGSELALMECVTSHCIEHLRCDRLDAISRLILHLLIIQSAVVLYVVWLGTQRLSWVLIFTLEMLA